MQNSKLIRVSSKGQIVLPKRYRDKLGITEGDYIVVQELNDGVLIIEKQPRSPLQTLAQDLRKEAGEKDFTREDLKQAIEAIREEKSPDAR